MRTQNRAAFTLVELAIVMVVIGLIVGGIIAGQSLLRASQIRGITNDLTTYVSAVQQFRNEFHQLPGDINTASSYWGAADGSTGSTVGCYTIDESNGTATCNGDGDGTVDRKNSITGTDDGFEDYLAWKHLSNAGLVAGSYSGITAVAGQRSSVGGFNGPKGKIDASVYVFRGLYKCYTGAGSDDDGDNFYTGCYGLVMYFGQNSSGVLHPGDDITPDEMYNIDRKIDDGLPGLGQFRALASDVSCSSDLNTYILNTAGLYCMGLLAVDPIQ